jgi:hypothetical protein
VRPPGTRKAAEWPPGGIGCRDTGTIKMRRWLIASTPVDIVRGSRRVEGY